MQLNFQPFDTALTQLGADVSKISAPTVNAHLSRLSELQARLDFLKIEVRQQAAALRSEGNQPVNPIH